jgi:hypothetical protein
MNPRRLRVLDSQNLHKLDVEHILFCDSSPAPFPAISTLRFFTAGVRRLDDFIPVDSSCSLSHGRSSLDHAANSVLTLLEKLHELSSNLCDFVGLIADELLDLDGLVHLSERVVDGRHALVETVGDGLSVALELDHELLAVHLVDIKDALGFSDTFRSVGNAGTSNLLDGLGDVHGQGDGSHFDLDVGCLFWCVNRCLLWISEDA